MVVWGDPGDMHVQHLLATGAVNPQWPADGVPLGATPFNGEGSVVLDGEGGVIVTDRDDVAAHDAHPRGRRAAVLHQGIPSRLRFRRRRVAGLFVLLGLSQNEEPPR